MLIEVIVTLTKVPYRMCEVLVGFIDCIIEVIMQIEDIIENVHQAVERGCCRIIINVENKTTASAIFHDLVYEFSKYTEVETDKVIRSIRMFKGSVADSPTGSYRVLDNCVKVNITTNHSRTDCFHLSGGTYDYILDLVPKDDTLDHVHRRAFLVGRMQHFRGVDRYYETDYEKTFIK